MRPLVKTLMAIVSCVFKASNLISADDAKEDTSTKIVKGIVRVSNDGDKLKPIVIQTADGSLHVPKSEFSVFESLDGRNVHVICTGDGKLIPQSVASAMRMSTVRSHPPQACDAALGSSTGYLKGSTRI